MGVGLYGSAAPAAGAPVCDPPPYTPSAYGSTPAAGPSLPTTYSPAPATSSYGSAPGPGNYCTPAASPYGTAPAAGTYAAPATAGAYPAAGSSAYPAGSASAYPSSSPSPAPYPSNRAPPVSCAAPQTTRGMKATHILFLGPKGMRVAPSGGSESKELECPFQHDFTRGQKVPLTLTAIPGARASNCTPRWS